MHPPWVPRQRIDSADGRGRAQSARVPGSEAPSRDGLYTWLTTGLDKGPSTAGESLSAPRSPRVLTRGDPRGGLRHASLVTRVKSSNRKSIPIAHEPKLGVFGGSEGWCRLEAQCTAYLLIR